MFLLFCNLVEGIRIKWQFPLWKYHIWEEVLEVGVGAALTLETSLTLYVLGPLAFFRHPWCLLDLTVTLLTDASIVCSLAYGLLSLEGRARPEFVGTLLLMVRAVLQPARVLAVGAGAIRARRLQREIDALPVDFAALSPGDSTISLPLRTPPLATPARPHDQPRS